jgi:hypothetical protein
MQLVSYIIVQHRSVQTHPFKCITGQLSITSRTMHLCEAVRYVPVSIVTSETTVSKFKMRLKTSSIVDY